MDRGTRKTAGILRVLALVTALALCLLPAVSSGQQPATGSDLDPTEEEIRRADRTLTLEDRSVVEGRLKAENGSYVYRIAVDVPKDETLWAFLQTDMKAGGAAVRGDGTRQAAFSQADPENPEEWRYEYVLEKWDPADQTALIRLTSDKEVRFSLEIMTDTWHNGHPDEPTAPPTSTPAPTEEPQHSPDPTATPEPEPTPEPYHPQGGGGGHAQPHAKNTRKPSPDYDHVSLEGLTDVPGDPMHRLALGGEELGLSLSRTGEEDEDAGFTASVFRWQAAEDPVPDTPDTLVLAAEETEGTNVWTLDGAVLRKLNRSGVEYLVLRDGDAITVMKTEGFLAGWIYDELKSRGTAGRRFVFTVETEPDAPAGWHLEVEGSKYELTRDESAGIRLTEVYDGTADALDRPPEEMTGENGKEEENAP